MTFFNNERILPMLTVSASIFFASACSQIETLSPTDSLSGNEFLAGTEEATKVSMQSDKSLKWEKDDAVAVYDGSGTSNYYATSAGASTTLAGKTVDADKNYYAFYPADAAMSFSGKTVTAEIPSVQTPIKNNLPFNPMVSSTTGKSKSFKFKNICGLIGFEISRSDIASVVIASNGGESLTGIVVVDCTSDAPSANVIKGKGLDYVSLQSPNVFAIGTYWVAVLPQKLNSGITCTMFSKTGEMVKKSTSKSFEVKRSRRVEISTIDDATPFSSYSISNAAELQAFLNSASGCSSSVIASLAGDIDLSGCTIIPAKSFAGTFDGAGHKISNWKSSCALFNSLAKTAVVKNLTIASSCSMAIPDNDDCAFIAILNAGTIQTCTNEAPMTSAKSVFTSDNPRYVGAFAARNTGTIENCHNHGNISLAPLYTSKANSSNYRRAMQYLGGIAGMASGTDGSAKITSCTNQGRISFISESYIGCHTAMGGILGGTPQTIAASATSWNCTDNVVISDCTNNASVTYSYKDPVAGMLNEPFIGGIAGYIEGSMKSCTNGSEGTIKVETPMMETSTTIYLRCSKIGGVAGVISGNLYSCTNNAAILTTCNLSNSASLAEICGSLTNPCIGGVAGEGTFNGEISDCHNKGDITLKNSKHTGAGTNLYLGGVIGYTSSTINGCSNSGKIRANSHIYNLFAGGVAGYTNKSVSSCDNLAGADLTFGIPLHSSGNRQPNIFRIGGVLGYTGVSSSPLTACNNAGAVTLDGSPVELYLGGVIGQSNSESARLEECNNMNGGNIDVIAGATATTVRVGGVAGIACGGFSSCSNNAAFVKFKGGAAADDKYIDIGGIAGRATGLDLLANSSSWNINKADVTINDTQGALRVGGAIGSGTKGAVYTKNEGDVTIDCSGTIQAIGGLVGYASGAEYSWCESSGNVNVGRKAKSNPSDAASALSGAGLFCGVIASNAIAKDSKAGGILTVSISDSYENKTPCGIVGSVSNGASISFGSGTSPFTVVKGSRIGSANIDSISDLSDAILVGKLNGTGSLNAANINVQ